MDEDQFNKEFDSLVDQHERCPTCSESPIEIGSTRQTDESGMEDEEFVLYAKCSNDHLYSVERRFDI